MVGGMRSTQQKSLISDAQASRKSALPMQIGSTLLSGAASVANMKSSSIAQNISKRPSNGVGSKIYTSYDGGTVSGVRGK